MELELETQLRWIASDLKSVGNQEQSSTGERERERDQVQVQIVHCQDSLFEP